MTFHMVLWYWSPNGALYKDPLFVQRNSRGEIGKERCYRDGHGDFHNGEPEHRYQSKRKNGVSSSIATNRPN